MYCCAKSIYTNLLAAFCLSSLSTSSGRPENTVSGTLKTLQTPCATTLASGVSSSSMAFSPTKPPLPVDLFFDAAGNYTGYDERYPTTRSGGKPEVIRALKAELSPSRIVMVGDGVSDLETQSEVDLFVGFGRYVERAKVKSQARAFVHSLAELPGLLT